MYRNIGNKDLFKEISTFGLNNYCVMWNKTPILVDDYKKDDNGDIIYDENEQPIVIGSHEDPVLVSWMEENFINYKPDLSEIKQVILDNFNAEIDSKILHGFVWESPEKQLINVYLSSENQFNYKAAYDLAYQSNGSSLPFVLKFGKTDEPQYYTFNDLETFEDFYISAITFINNTLHEGWIKKDSIDWDKYII